MRKQAAISRAEVIRDKRDWLMQRMLQNGSKGFNKLHSLDIYSTHKYYFYFYRWTWHFFIRKLVDRSVVHLPYKNSKYPWHIKLTAFSTKFMQHRTGKNCIGCYYPGRPARPHHSILLDIKMASVLTSSTSIFLKPKRSLMLYM